MVFTRYLTGLDLGQVTDFTAMVEEDARLHFGFDRTLDRGTRFLQHCKEFVARAKPDPAAGQVATRAFEHRHIPAGFSQQIGGKQTAKRSTDD